MKNRVYYGEYNLRHWIELILTKNIILPDYQRYFVWDRTKVEKLIDSLHSEEFIPPVTIGAFEMEGGNQNLLLDGQQRLTSILLAYLNLYPSKKKHQETIEIYDDDIDLDDEHEEYNILRWNLNSISDVGRSKSEILNNIQKELYDELNFSLDDDFFENKFLGFSYLVPHDKDVKYQQRYYSSVFRNINIQGKSLLPQESRESLYFLDKDLTAYFSPDFIKEIRINNSPFDFVRYLALLSQYHNFSSVINVAKGFKKKMEAFYEDYIYSVVNEDKGSNQFSKFSEIFPKGNYNDGINKLEECLEKFGAIREYQSIIDVDIYFFGIIYHILYNKKVLPDDSFDALKEKLNDYIKKCKEDPTHTKSPNAFNNLRTRIEQSIIICDCYFINESQSMNIAMESFGHES